MEFLRAQTTLKYILGKRGAQIEFVGDDPRFYPPLHLLGGLAAFASGFITSEV